MTAALFIAAAVLLRRLRRPAGRGRCRARGAEPRRPRRPRRRQPGASARCCAIADDTGAHVNAVNFMRVIAETTAAVLVTLAFASLFDSTGGAMLLVAALIMTGISFVLVGSSPRSVGRAHADGLMRVRGAGRARRAGAARPARRTALVALGNRVTPGRPRLRRSRARSSCSAWSTRPPSSTCSRRTTASSSTRSSSSATPSCAR